jgi:hypothetical protein
MKLNEYKILPAVALFLACGTLAHAQRTNVPTPTQYEAFSQFIANRNIFDPNRRPSYGSPPPRTRDPVVESFSLVGTMSYQKGNFAFFDGTSSNLRKALEVDDEIAGFKVTAVKPDCVTLVSGTNETVMKLSTQMRREDDGPWTYLAEAGTYSGNSFAGNSRRRNGDFGGRRRDYGGNSRNSFPNRPSFFSTPNTDTSAEGVDPNAAGDIPPDQMNLQDGQPENTGDSAAGLDANDPIQILMRRRVEEEQRLLQQ